MAKPEPEPCDHLIGVDDGYYDEGHRLRYDEEFRDQSISLRHARDIPEDEFNFCPLCGASLEALWREVYGKDYDKRI